MKPALIPVVLCAMLGVGSQAAVIFFDDFDSSLPATTLNAAVPGWTTTDGTVDYVKSGSFGITCFGGVGGCIDLDGSTSDAATPFETKASFSIMPGTFYVLSFRLSGNQRGGSTDTVSYAFGDLSGTVGPLAPTDPFGFYSFSFFATKAGSSTIRFANAGGDNIGAILDDVKLEAIRKGGGEVPEPSSFALLGAGVMGLLARRLRR
jgi:hypothetical protein